MHVSMITGSLGRMVVFDDFENRVGKDAPVLDSGRSLSKGAVDTFLNGQKGIVNNNLVSNMLEIGIVNKDLSKRVRSRRIEGKRRENYTKSAALTL